MKRPNTKKVVKGMSAYFIKVKNIELGKSDIDFLMLNTPPICNYQCKKCFTSARSIEIKNPLTLKELFQIIKEGKKMGAKSVSILGEGEPLVYKNIRELIAFIDASGMIPIIATNGSNLTKEMVHFLYEHNTTIGISLDTLNEKEYNEWCRGEADLSKVLNNIEYTRKLYANRIYEKNACKVYQLLIHMTITPKNIKRIDKIRNFCGEDIFFDCQPLAIVGDAKQHSSYFGKNINYKQYQQEGHLLFPPMVLTKTGKGKYICCLFWYGLSVSYNGEVMFDTHAIEPKNYIGNIRDFPLIELLKKVKQLRKYYLDNYISGYCPVRSESYQKFLKELKKNNLLKR